MKKLYFTIGLPASGKTTWAKKMVDENQGMVINICKDDLREMLYNGSHSKGREKIVREMRNNLTIKGFENGLSVIWSDTNLHPMHLEKAKEIAGQNEAKVEIIDFTNIDIETCIERDLKRLKSVGERVIKDLYRTYIKTKVSQEKQNEMKKIAKENNLPKAIICDLDGTLCELNGRNPFDTAKCEEDLLNEPIANLLKNYHSLNYKIILASGRDEIFKEQTENWLKKYEVFYDNLFMRKHKDQRKDAIIKNEIFDQYIRNKYYTEFIIDDRPQVIRMWRELGLLVFQVNDIEF